jgi:hypothetical protein
MALDIMKYIHGAACDRCVHPLENESGVATIGPQVPIVE